MKKGMVLLIFLLILAQGPLFADHPGGLGIGVMGRGGWGFGEFGSDAGIALTLKLPSLPVFWGIGAELGKWHSGVNLSGDLYLINTNFDTSLLGWYFGLGLFAGFSFWDAHKTHPSHMGFTAGIRTPIGLSLQLPVNRVVLEFFLTAVPRIGFGTWIGDRSGTDIFMNLGGEFGFRAWF